jgi:acetolactate synthase-1/2/3 large subunit
VSDIVHLAEELHQLGTRCVFGIPGEGPSSSLIAELEERGCAFHLVSHEASGTLMAGGFGRVTNTPGVSLSIKGPGFSNMLAGIASNWLDRTPVLSLAESYGPGSSPFRMHKRMTHSTMLRSVVKAYADNVDPKVVRQLWNLSLAEDPGPVHMDISRCMKQASWENYSSQPYQSRVLSSDVTKRVRDARHPVIIAGALVTRREWREKLSTLRIPVFTTVAGKGAVDETLPCSAGIFTNSGGPISPEQGIIPNADLVIGLGLRTTEILDVEPFSVPLILLDEVESGADGLEAVAEITGTSAVFLEMLDLLESKEWGMAEVAAARHALEKKLQLQEWLPAGSLGVVQETLPPSTLFVLDTGSFCVIGEHILKARRAGQVIGSALGRSMGTAIPLGIGSSLAAPKTPTVVVVGDGGIRMYPQEITIAAREKLPLLILFMTDGFFASVREEVSKMGPAREWLKVESSCWRDVFEGFGCQVERIGSLASLGTALRSWDWKCGPLFLEMAFDADRYMAMTDGVR